jgi:hypothetical protein
METHEWICLFVICYLVGLYIFGLNKKKTIQDLRVACLESIRTELAEQVSRNEITLFEEMRIMAYLCDSIPEVKAELEEFLLTIIRLYGNEIDKKNYDLSLWMWHATAWLAVYHGSQKGTNFKSELEWSTKFIIENKEMILSDKTHFLELVK